MKTEIATGSTAEKLVEGEVCKIDSSITEGIGGERAGILLSDGAVLKRSAGSWMEIVARPLGRFIYGSFNRNLLRWNPSLA